MPEPMSRIDVLREVCKTVQRLNGDIRQLTVYEITDDDAKALSPRTGLLHTIVRTGNVQHVAAGADVVVLHAQRAAVLQVQIAHLTAIGVGFIVVPNTNPAEEAYQTHPCASTVWTGNGWKAVAAANLLGLRYVATIEADHGTSVLFPNGWRHVVCLDDLPNRLDWAGLVEYRGVWLRLVEPAFFSELLAGPKPPSVATVETPINVQPETPAEPTTTPTPSTPTRARRTRRYS